MGGNKNPALVYTQASGHLYLDGQRIGIGYAGQGVGFNNPSEQFHVNTGPLPCGLYTLVDILPILEREFAAAKEELDRDPHSMDAQKHHAGIRVVLANTRKMGPIVFRLDPHPGNNMGGRGSFYLHWSSGALTFLDSKGCIIQLMAATFYALRGAVASRPITLLVVPTEADRPIFTTS